MALLTEIESPYWQPSLQGSGMVVEGLDDIRQCIDVLLRTQKGTDPLRPEFGSDIYQYIDGPVNFVIPSVKRAIIEAMQLFESRVEVVSITHQTKISNIQFFITYRLVDDIITDQLQLYVGTSGFIVAASSPGAFILEAAIPAYGSFQLALQFTIDGFPVLPIPPEFGFATPGVMYAWVLDNWGSFGSWYLLPGELVLYMNPGIATTATLSISVLEIYRYASIVPALSVGELYGLSFSEISAFALHTTVSNVLSELLAYATTTYGSYGLWVVESWSGLGDFDKIDFNEIDFNVGTFYQLVLYSYTQNLEMEVTID